LAWMRAAGSLIDDPMVREFVEGCGRSLMAIESLRIVRFICEVFGVRPSEISRLAVRDDFWRRLFSEFRRRGLTAVTVRKKQSALKKWLDFFGVRGVDWDYVNRVKGQIYGRGNLTRNLFAEREGEFSREDVRRLLFYGCRSLREKVMVLFMATSGISLGDLCMLKLKDIQDLWGDRDCYRIEYRRGKTGTKAITFITRETRDVFLDYLEERRSQGEEINDESYVIAGKRGGLSRTRRQSIFMRIFERAGYVEPIGRDARGHSRNKYHSHLLRKFFRTALRNAGVERIYVEAMMGHDIRGMFGVEMVYDKQADKPEVLEEQYRRAIPQLTFLSELPYLEQKRREAELEERVRRLEKILKKLLALQTQHSLQDLEAL